MSEFCSVLNNTDNSRRFLSLFSQVWVVQVRCGGSSLGGKSCCSSLGGEGTGWEYQEKGMKWFFSQTRGRSQSRKEKPQLLLRETQSFSSVPFPWRSDGTVFPGDEASAIPAELETQGEENNHKTPFSSSNQAGLGSGGGNSTLGPRWEGAGAQEGKGGREMQREFPQTGTTVSLSSVAASRGG